MMKIGLIADIHADLDGLAKALKFLHEKQVDTILCAGDLVERGKDSDAVVERIRELKIPTVQGNHDAFARRSREHLRNQSNTDPTMIYADETIEYVDTLPLKLDFTFENYSLVLIHGALWDEQDLIFPASDRDRFQYVLDEDDPDYIVLGHTHVPMIVKVVGHGTVINPGAICGNMSLLNFPEVEGHSCAILSLPHGTITHYDFYSGTVMPVPQRTIEA
jgi:putative phosphoesterase